MTEGDNPLPAQPEAAGPEQFRGEDEPGPDANRRVEDEPQAPANDSHGSTNTENEAPIAKDVLPYEYEDIRPGENSREDEVLEIDEDSPKIEKDIGRALAKGLAENEKRTKATKFRKARRALEVYSSISPDIEGELAKPRPEVTARFGWKKYPQQQALIAYAEREVVLRQELQDLEERTRAAQEGIRPMYSSHSLEHAKNKLSNESYKEAHSSWMTTLAEHARYLDEAADRREEIAGVLHDHPPSEAYKTVHPFEIDYSTAEGCMEMEEYLQGDLEEALEKSKSEEKSAQIEDLLEAVVTIESNLENLDRDLDNLTIVSGKPFEMLEDLRAKLDRVEKDEAMTIGEIKKLAVSIPKTIQKVIEAQIEYVKQILEDVKSGRASDPNYKEPAPEPALSTETTV